jgi:hypothetical protein
MHKEVHKIYLFIFLSLYPKILAIASGATPIGSAGCAPDDIYSWLLKQKEQIRKFYYSHRERPSLSIKVIRVLYTLKQSNKATTYDPRVALSQQNSNVMIYHEGKTPGSILCGPVYAHGCALLVCIHVYDAKKNPGGCTGYPENHWDSFFVSPKCGKRMDLTGFPNSSPRGLNLK